MHIVYVAAGGALGATLRYLCSIGINQLATSGLPMATLCVNILGSFLLGVLLAGLVKVEAAEAWRLFFAVGVLGSFTTFSTFSFESVTLLMQGEWLKGMAYIALSLCCCLIAVVVGLKVADSLFGT